jgi:hypoxanthine phosphoribosyltransferase
MSDKIYFTWEQIEKQTQTLIRAINLSHWTPDYVVGITRGGLMPANLISQWFDVPMYSLDVSFRDINDIGPESNCWMAEDAFGYTSGIDGPFEAGTIYSDVDKQKNILVVDDINDSGKTINWIKQDWQSSCLPNDPAWENIFSSNVRFATLIDNTVSEAKVDYSAVKINKFQDPGLWVVFPWEDWWLNGHD